MARGPVHRTTLDTINKAEQLAARAEAFKKIEKLLGGGWKTSPELAELTGLPRTTVSNYLNHMNVKLGAVRMTKQKRGRAALWALGEDLDAPDEDEEVEQVVVTRPRVQAQQLGMRRDYLVAALFGPAQGAAA